MPKKISIAIDAMGGDNSPDKTIEGVKIFLEKNISTDDFILNIFGKENELISKLNKYKIDINKVNIINTNTTISNNETPLTAIKILEYKYVELYFTSIEGKSDISLSAGNTGVLLVISKMILKMMEGVSKPALAGLWPTRKVWM